VSHRALRMLVASLFVVSCGGDATGPSSVAGTWRFDASYAFYGYSCTIVTATLFLQPTTFGWLGTLSGDPPQCTAPPGELPVSTLLAEGLQDLRVHGDSIAFTFAKARFSIHGTQTPDAMAGTLQVATYCQCPGQYQTGTWTATRP
jgi:hypothetical protein